MSFVNFVAFSCWLVWCITLGNVISYMIDDWKDRGDK